MNYLVTLLLYLSVSITTYAQQNTISIYYTSGKYKLTSTQKKTIDSLAYHDLLVSSNQYIIIGYADVVGTEQSNLKLSERRAEEMAQYLSTLGIKHIETVIGKGEVDKPVNTKGYPTDRRVDIVSSKKAIAKSSLPDITKLKPNDVFDLENMFFVGGKPILLKESIPTLKKLLAVLKANPSVSIKIEGHVHCYSFNKWRNPNVRLTREQVRQQRQNAITEKRWHYELSTARAKTVYQYLADNGIDSNRLKYVGLSCKGIETHPKNNRRVAIRILSIGDATISDNRE